MEDLIGKKSLNLTSGRNWKVVQLSERHTAVRLTTWEVVGSPVTRCHCHIDGQEVWIYDNTPDFPYKMRFELGLQALYCIFLSKPLHLLELYIIYSELPWSCGQLVFSIAKQSMVATWWHMAGIHPVKFPGFAVQKLISTKMSRRCIFTPYATNPRLVQTKSNYCEMVYLNIFAGDHPWSVG